MKLLKETKVERVDVPLSQEEIYWILSRLEHLRQARDPMEERLYSRMKGFYKGAPVPQRAE